MDLSGGTTPVKGTPKDGADDREVINPDLQQFLQDHSTIQTATDLINYAYAEGGDARLQELCDELHLDYDEISTARSTRLEEYVYAGPVLSDTLPSSTTGADGAFLTQFGDSTYNPEGASSTHNCGPTSLAMALNASGNMPEGLNPQQQIDYARALMFPKDGRITTVNVGGRDIPQLHDDATDTTLISIAGASRRSDAGEGTNQTGWANLDAALANGQPVVVNGTISDAWAGQFSGDYHQEGSGHMIAVLGRTEDGNYLVADPLHAGGTVEMTRAELAVFSREPEFVAVGGGE